MNPFSLVVFFNFKTHLKALVGFLLLFQLAQITVAQVPDNERINFLKDYMLKHNPGSPVYYPYAGLVDYYGFVNKTPNKDGTVGVDMKKLNRWIADIKKQTKIEMYSFSAEDVSKTAFFLIPKELINDYDSYGEKYINYYKSIFNDTGDSSVFFIPIKDVGSSDGAKSELLRQFLISRKELNAPLALVSEKNDYNISIPYGRLISKRIYPYFGRVTINMVDSQEKTLGSFGYIYDREKEILPWGEVKFKEFKATVEKSSITNRYVIYCDGEKVSSIYFEAKDLGTATFETNNFGISFLNTLLQTVVNGYVQKVQIDGFRNELYRIAQTKVCYYAGDTRFKGKTKSDSLFLLAKRAYTKGDPISTMQLLDAAAWAEPSDEVLELRADIQSKSGFVPDAVVDYVSAANLIRSKQNSNREKLARIYRKMAISLSCIVATSVCSVEGMNDFVLSPSMAIDYVNKAAELGDGIAKSILTEKNDSDIIEKLSKLR